MSFWMRRERAVSNTGWLLHAIRGPSLDELPLKERVGRVSSFLVDVKAMEWFNKERMALQSLPL